MSSAIDTYILFQIIQKLAKPFEEFDAFKLGLIDAKGKLLKKAKTTEEKNAYDPLERFVINIKRIMSKYGLGSKTTTYAVTALLLREGELNDLEELTLVEAVECLNEDVAATTTGGMATTSLPMKFGDSPVFKVDHETFWKSRMGKVKYGRYKDYMSEADLGLKISEYARKNPQKAILLQHKETGEYTIFRRNYKGGF